jgi:hypothetical protein
MCRRANSQYQCQLEKRHRPFPWRVRHVGGGWWLVVHCVTKYEVDRSRDRAWAEATRDALNVEADRAQPVWASPALVGQVRHHLRRIRQLGVGLRRVGQLTGLSRSRLTEILAGRAHRADRPKKRRLKYSTAQRILATPIVPAAHAVVDAGPTWERITALRAAGWTKVRIAEAIGQQRALQLGRARILARHATAIALLVGQAPRTASPVVQAPGTASPVAPRASQASTRRFAPRASSLPAAPFPRFSRHPRPDTGAHQLRSPTALRKGFGPLPPAGSRLTK